MKNIVSFDLGTASVGWAHITQDDKGMPIDIEGLGVRRVPLKELEGDKFAKGQSVSVNADRTISRTTRKCYDRYQLRRKALTDNLRQLGMLPDEHLIKLPVMELWQLRADAVTKQVGLPELGRILYHINQKRGYRGAKSDSQDSKQRAYVKAVNGRYAEIKELNQTIGQHFAEKLSETAIRRIEDGVEKILYTYRIKDQVFPRAAYEEEFDKIMSCQQQFYPDILTDDVINEFRNKIIFYQRELRSCKHLVSLCEFEKRCFWDKNGNIIRDKNGDIVYDGPKVTPRTSPLFQLCRLWEAVNTIELHNRKNELFPITTGQRAEMVSFLNKHEKIQRKDVLAILGLESEAAWYGTKQLASGIKGNDMLLKIRKALSPLSAVLIGEITRFDIKVVDTNYKNPKTGEHSPLVDTETGEILRCIDSSYEHEPLYRLWHIMYSIKNIEEEKKALRKFLSEFSVVDEGVVESLAAIDFVTPGYGNKSAKFICKILPYLQEGLVYSEACEYVGINHSNSLTTDENNRRELKEVIPALKKGELRQPVVEKILNQMINIFNAINARLRASGNGQIDEVRVELARELRQSKEERANTYEQQSKQQKENKKWRELIEQHPGMKATRNRIMKYRMWEETGHCCFYCGQLVNCKQFLEGEDVEREHIIPKKLLFDDSFGNLVCSCRKCNEEKGGRTALDYMRTKPKAELDSYLERVTELYEEHKISGKKRRHLLTSYDDYLVRKQQGKETEEDIAIWEQFIDRQLRLSQYISKKALEILSQGCRNVHATSGSITDLVRHVWGYDTIIHDLCFPRYKAAGLTEMKTIKRGNKEVEVEVIAGWDKRKDHRHHAIDALAIACTTQSMIQRINTLNASREEMFADVQASQDVKDDDMNLLQNWIKVQQPFSREQVMSKVSEIMISIKAGKRATTPGKRKIYTGGKPKVMQEGLVVPRGSLHEQTVYGRINGKDIVVRYPIGLGMGMLFPSASKLKLNVEKNKKGEWEIIDSFEDSIKYIVDKHIQEAIKSYINSIFEGGNYRAEAEQAKENGEKYDGKDVIEKIVNQLKTIGENPIYADKAKTIPVRRVRCYTGLSAVQPLRYDGDKPIAFVVTGNNHHVALYRDAQGKMREMVVTFWEAVERKKYGLPILIDNPQQVQSIIHGQEIHLPEGLAKNLPKEDWTFLTSLQQDDMFILGMTDEEYQSTIAQDDKVALASHLYRVQSISIGDYWFRLHTETENDKTSSGKVALKFYRVKSLDAFERLNPKKVRISILGERL